MVRRKNPPIASLCKSIVRRRVAPAPSSIRANTLAEMGSRGFDLRSCREYPKYGTTAVISRADALCAASIASRSRTQFSAGGFVGWTRKTFLPRRFSRNCTCCSPSLNDLHLIFPNGTPSLSAIFFARPSFAPRLKILYSMEMDYTKETDQEHLISFGGPWGNRTPASAMRMPRNTTLLRARNKNRIYYSLSSVHFRAAGNRTRTT